MVGADKERKPTYFTAIGIEKDSFSLHATNSPQVHREGCHETCCVRKMSVTPCAMQVADRTGTPCNPVRPQHLLGPQ